MKRSALADSSSSAQSPFSIFFFFGQIKKTIAINHHAINVSCCSDCCVSGL